MNDGEALLRLQAEKYEAMARAFPAGSAAYRAATATAEATRQALDVLREVNRELPE